MDSQPPAECADQLGDRGVGAERAEALDAVIAGHHRGWSRLAQDGLDLVKVDTQAEDLGDALAAARQEEVALVVKVADVARTQDSAELVSDSQLETVPRRSRA